MTKPKSGKRPRANQGATTRTAQEAKREATKRTIMRNATGSTLLSNGRFMLDKDKDLGKLTDIA